MKKKKILVGVRTLDDEELPLLVRNEMQQDDLNNIRCIIRKACQQPK